MKKLLIFLLIWSMQNTMNAQTPDFAPWCPSGATWIYQYFLMWGESYIKFQFEKDTVINQIAVKKINVYDLDYTFEPSISKMYTSYQYVSNDSLYRYNDPNNTFDFIYKFNASIGDEHILKGFGSCFGDNNYPLIDTFTISETGFDTLSGVIYPYSIYHSNTGNYDLGKVYNNIGSTSTPLPQVSNVGCPSIGMNSFLSLFCYYDDIRGYLGSSSISDSICNKLNTLNLQEFPSEPKAPHVFFSIYPNPASSNFSIKIHSNSIHWEDIQSIQLINDQGKYIPLTSLAQNVFPIEHLASGLYIVEIRYKNGIERVKLLKY